MSLRLHLVRHGRVDFASKDFRNTPRGPQWDPPLGEEGREQAERLALRLAAMGTLAGLYVSPYRRCRQTVRPYEERAGARAEVVDDLREVFIGEWEGVPFEDLVAEREELVRARFIDQEPVFKVAPGAETGEELRGRVVPAIEGMLARAGDGADGGGDEGNGGDVVVVAHGGVINAYLVHILGLPQDMLFLPDNASVNTVDVDGFERRVRFLNDVAHLWYPEVFEARLGR